MHRERLKQVKSIEKVKKQSKIVKNNNKLICIFCDKKSTSHSNLLRHKSKYCKIYKKYDTDDINILKVYFDEIYKKNKEIIIDYDNKIKKYEKRIEELENKLLSTLKVPKIRSVYNYIKINYPDAPKLENNICSPESLFKNETKLEHTLFKNYNNKCIHKYIGDLLVAFYKKENPKNQSIWLTDNNKNRISFIIYTNLQNINSWHIDKAGILITNMIIKPVINYIFNIIETYEFTLHNKLNNKLYEINLNETQIKNQINICSRLLANINTGQLCNNILHYIANYFYISKSMRIIDNKNLINTNLNNCDEIEDYNEDLNLSDT